MQPMAAYARRCRAIAGAPRRHRRPAATAAAPAEDDAKLSADQEPDGRHLLRRPSPAPSRSSPSARAVDEDTDVCIIEAMKVFNNIKAECRGTIAKILVQDGQPVEFGQVLFLVKPDEAVGSRQWSVASADRAFTVYCN